MDDFKLEFDFHIDKKLTSVSQWKNSVFCKGCKWSPDGFCLLTNSDDNCLRIFDLPAEPPMTPSMTPSVEMKEAECIYDFDWFPFMNSTQPESCVLASTSRYQPIHLFDAFDGHIRATYRCYDQVDEVCAASSIRFSSDGCRLYAGLKGEIRVFDVSVPGRDYLFSRKTERSRDSRQRGIISCIDVNPTVTSLYACGSYDRSAAVYSEPEGTMLLLCRGQKGGVTQVTFSPDGRFLLVGGRKDDEILVWDLRNPGKLLFVLGRSVKTNQRISFDVFNQYVITGTTEGDIKIFDLSKSPTDICGDPILTHVWSQEALHLDCINGVSVHSKLPLLATTTGQRHFPQLSENDDSPTFAHADNAKIENSVKIWNFAFSSN